MKFSLDQMETIRYQFDSFCRKVLRDYNRDIEMHCSQVSGQVL